MTSWWKRIFGSSQPSPKGVDPARVRFSVFTLDGAVPAGDGQPIELLAGEPQLHEDDWRSLEFFAPEREEELRTTLRALRAHEAAQRDEHEGQVMGWREVFVRRLPVAPVLTGPGTFRRIERVLRVPAGPPPVLGTSSGPSARVPEGFGYVVTPDVLVYGVCAGEDVTVLALDAQPGPEAHETLAKLQRELGLLFVSWRSFELIAPDGVVWMPEV